MHEDETLNEAPIWLQNMLDELQDLEVEERYPLGFI
jgi:hypothetical protein